MNTETGEIKKIEDNSLELACLFTQMPATPLEAALNPSWLPPMIDRLEAKAAGRTGYSPEAVAAELMKGFSDRELASHVPKWIPNPEYANASHVCLPENGMFPMPRAIIENRPEKLIELRCNPDPECKVCEGKGHRGREADGKFHPCPCCAPLIWCNTHKRLHAWCEYGCGGVAMPCAQVDLTGLAEIDEERLLQQ